MGLLKNIFLAKATGALINRINGVGRREAAPREEYIPAANEPQVSLRDRVMNNGQMVATRANQLYRDNPKLVKGMGAGLGVIAAAMVLHQLGRKRSF